MDGAVRSWMPGKLSDVPTNSDPQPEGYSYVNLAVVMRVGTDGRQIAATRASRADLSGESAELRLRGRLRRHADVVVLRVDGDQELGEDLGLLRRLLRAPPLHLSPVVE